MPKLWAGGTAAAAVANDETDRATAMDEVRVEDFRVLLSGMSERD